MASTRDRQRARRPRRELEERAPVKDDDRDERDDEEQGGQDEGAVSQLKGVMSEAAVSVLAPVAKKFATQAAKMAIERGPELLEDTILPKLQDAGGMLGGLGEKFGGGEMDEDSKGGAGDGTGKGRRMPIQQSVDVGAPLEVVYDQFTQFEDFPKFMHRVERAEQRDDEHVVFTEKMWGIRRQWEAEIVEQRPDERIVWKTTSGMNHVGVVTFHELAERLTRVELNLDLDPDGPIEKIARGARFVKRAARADLKRFKAFVEMRDEETGAWRGAIQDGDVIDEDEYYDDDEYEDEPEARGEEDDEPEAREDEDDEDEQADEPEAREDDDEEAERDESDDEDEDEEQSHRATAKQKSNGGRSRSRTRAAKAKSASSSRSRSASKPKAKSTPKSTSGNGRRKSTASRSRAKATSSKK
jgi:uncharacterized membrane protein